MLSRGLKLHYPPRMRVSAFLLVIVTSLVAWFAYRRSRREDGAPPGAVRTAAVLIGLLLVLIVVALYAMTTKPA
jgi:hypothetical protein